MERLSGGLHCKFADHLFGTAHGFVGYGQKLRRLPRPRMAMPEVLQVTLTCRLRVGHRLNGLPRREPRPSKIVMGTDCIRVRRARKTIPSVPAI